MNTIITLALGSVFAFPTFRHVTVEPKVGIGYGIALADVDGDAKTDIVLQDKDALVWYQNPGWQKHVVAEKLTALDHVCVAARDLDGDGKAEIAAGAGWNPGDTEGSGSVHYLVPGADRAQKWTPVELHHEPTVHRMRWIMNPAKGWDLLVVPLHGRGNKNSEGAGVRSLIYTRPADPKAEWKTQVLDEAMHVTHNFDPVQWDTDPEHEVLLAGKEGVFLFDRKGEGWSKTRLSEAGAGEVRAGKLAGGQRFFATVEPFHGTKAAVYLPPAGGSGLWTRVALDDSLNEGHALACGDLVGDGMDQVVVGWRMKDAKGKVGIRVFQPADAAGKTWKAQLLDDDGMACEDLAIADMDGDGKLDVVASGRATKNLKVYFNQGGGK